MVAGWTLAALGVGLAGRIWYARALPAAERARHQDDLPRWPHDEALLLAARVARLSDACADAERFITAFEETFGQTAASRLEWALLGAQQGDLAGVEAASAPTWPNPTRTPPRSSKHW